MTFEQMLAELQQEYVANLPVKIDEMEAKLMASQHEQLREDFHKLKGTGKTYGIPEISELSEVVEQICLRQPHCMSTAVPEALNLLKDIHGERRASRAFNLSVDQRFSLLKALL